VKHRITRRDFIKVAGAGAAGTAVLGASTGGLGCSYIPKGGNAMNVVLVVMDNVRPDHIGAYGNDWIQTPNLDKLAGESLSFSRASPECIPTISSRRSLHTGTRNWPFRDWDPLKSDLFKMPGWQPISEDRATLAEILSEEGYSTMFVTDVPHQLKPSYNMHRGFKAFDFIRGQERDFHKPLSVIDRKELEEALTGDGIKQEETDIVRQHFANTRGREGEEDWFAPQVFSKAMEFMKDASNSDDPFFLMIDAYDPHEPWDPPEEYASLYGNAAKGPKLMSSSSGRSFLLGEKKVNQLHDLYSAMLTMSDRWFGRFMDKFRELNLAENTLLIFVSDHGHAFGEHGFAGKVPQALYPELTDIVFMMRHPEGKKAGETSDYFASTHDIPQTVLSALGLTPPDAMNGENLYGLFEDDGPEERDHFTLGYKDYILSRDNEYAMIVNKNGGSLRLFDIQEDPKFETNTASQNQDIAQKMFKEYVLKDAGGPLPDY
jgi:arylsulfatase A-like enzyme